MIKRTPHESALLDVQTLDYELDRALALTHAVETCFYEVARNHPGVVADTVKVDYVPLVEILADQLETAQELCRAVCAALEDGKEKIRE